MGAKNDRNRPAPTTDAERLRVCRLALTRVAKLDVPPEPNRYYYSASNVTREQALVGLAQAALLDCWPDVDRLPEPLGFPR